jgi:hypothetical protein
MKKRLLFFYRYLTASRHFRLWRARWITVQSLMVVGLLVAFWGLIASTTPAEPAVPAAAGGGENAGLAMNSGAALNELVEQRPALQDATPDPNQRPTRTPLPPEYYANTNQTDGLIVASVVLVLVVVAGVLILQPRREHR